MITLASQDVWTGVLIAAAVIVALLGLVTVVRELRRAGRPRAAETAAPGATRAEGQDD
ncbi:hypothetical protein [Mariniluteicoccus flavus]